MGFEEDFAVEVDHGDLVFVSYDEYVLEGSAGVDEVSDGVQAEGSQAGQFPDDGAGWQVGGEVGGAGSLLRGLRNSGGVRSRG